MPLKITDTLGWSISSWKDLLGVLSDYTGKEYTCALSHRETVSITHSPLGTWVHNMYPKESIAISGYAEKGREIKEVVLKYPVTVVDLMCHLILIEDASRVVSRSPEDPYYAQEGKSWEFDQFRYRNEWEEQDKIMPHEVSQMAEMFHQKNSVTLNGNG